MILALNQFGKNDGHSFLNLMLMVLLVLFSGYFAHAEKWVPDPTVVVTGIIEDRFNVMDFGAVGDGVTDDTLAIRKAIAAAGAWADANDPEVATVYFPAGEYAVAPQESDASWATSKPHIFEIPTSNVYFVGEGHENSVISCYTVGLADPNTNWTVVGDGSGYLKIKRGRCFILSLDGIHNVVFDGLRITGNADATGNAAVGGAFRRLSVLEGRLRAYSGKTVIKHGYSRGTILRFGSSKNIPHELVPQQPYYVVNATADSFQLAETPGGEAVALSDTVNNSEHRFYATNGDGWNMGHNAVKLASRSYKDIEIRNCRLDRWRGEIIHGGGNMPRTLTIRDSILEHCNASMVSVPSLILEDSIIRYGYNGIENYARQPWHTAEIRRCQFIASEDRRYGESNGIAFLGSPETSAIFEDNYFEGWYRGIYLAEVAHNVDIRENEFFNVYTGIVITRLDLYKNDPWSGFDNITVELNDFRTSINLENAIYTQFGDVSNRNFVIRNNTLHESEESGRWMNLISDRSASSLENRLGYVIEGNKLSGVIVGGRFNGSVRPIWINNTRSTFWQWGHKFDIHFQEPGIPVEIAFNDDHVFVRNHSDLEFVDITLDSELIGKFPVGYQIEVESPEEKGCRFLPDATWNTFDADVLVTRDNPVLLVVGEDGKFGVFENPSQEEPIFPIPPEANIEAKDSEFLLKWSSPGRFNSIEVEASVNGAKYDEFGKWSFEGIDADSLTLEGLEQGSEYRFRVRVIRDRQASSWTETDEVFVPQVSPDHHFKFDEGSGLLANDTGLGELYLYLDQVNWGPGIGTSSSGIEFTGEHSGVCLPDSKTLNLTDNTTMTISLWVLAYGESVNLTSVLFEHGDYWRGISLILENGWLLAKGWNRPEHESGWAGTRLYGGQLSLDNWNHVALVLDGEEVIKDNALFLYVNGVLVNSGPGSKLWTVLDKTGLGQIQGSSNYREREIRALDPFQGIIDDLQIWNRVLTVNEITELILESSL